MLFFFFNVTTTTDIYTLSLHDALPIFKGGFRINVIPADAEATLDVRALPDENRSEEHTSELQSPMYLVCRLLLEKKNTIKIKDVEFYERYVSDILKHHRDNLYTRLPVI